MHKCKVIAIANQKGGVGKTTTAASLGVGLVRQGKKVMLIDADPQGSLSLSLGIEKPDNLETTIANVMERIVEDKEIEPGFAIVQTKEGIDLMPANIELSGIEVRLVNEMSRERVLKRYVDSKRQDYDFIIILPLLSAHCFLPVFTRFSTQPSCRRLQPRSRVSLTTQVKEKPLPFNIPKPKRASETGALDIFK